MSILFFISIVINIFLCVFVYRLKKAILLKDSIMQENLRLALETQNVANRLKNDSDKMKESLNHAMRDFQALQKCLKKDSVSE